MANYNISISVDTSGAISALNALNTSLDTTQNKLNQAQQASNQATNNMSNGFGDLAQQLQNFDQGITKIIENFLKLKGIADELLGKSIEQFKKREQENLSLNVVLNTSGAYGDINRFNSEVRDGLASLYQDQLQTSYLVKDTNAETLKFYEDKIRSLIPMGADSNTYATLKNTIEESLVNGGKGLADLIKEQLTKVQQTKIDTRSKVDSEIKRLTQITKFSPEEIASMFGKMLSYGISPDILLKPYMDAQGKQFTMLSKITDLASALAPEFGEDGLRKSSELIYQVLKTASLGEKTDFNSNIQNLGTYLDQMLTAFSKTPLNIQNIGDVLVRNMGINEKLYSMQWSEFLTLAGQLLQAKSGAETGEYIHATLRGYTQIQQNIDRLDAEKRLELSKIKTNKQGEDSIKGPNTRATLKSLNMGLLANPDLLKMTQLSGIGEYISHLSSLPQDLSLQINDAIKSGNTETAKTLLQQYFATKGFTEDKGIANSLTTVLTSIYREAEQLGKGVTVLTQDIADELVKQSALVKKETEKGAVYELQGNIFAGKYTGLTDKGEPNFNPTGDALAKIGDQFKIGENIPLMRTFINGTLMGGIDKQTQQFTYIQKKLDEVEKQGFMYNVSGNDLVTTTAQLFMLGGGYSGIIGDISLSLGNLNYTMEELGGTLTQVDDINEGLYQLFYTSISANAGELYKYLGNITRAMLSSKASMDRETSKSFDGMLGTSLLILSVAGKVGAIIGTALALSASYALIMPYLQGDLFFIRVKEMLPFLKYIGLGSILLIGLSLALQKVFFEGSSLSKMFADIGSIITDTLIPAIVSGQTTAKGYVGFFANGLITLRNLVVGFFNGFSDLLSVIISAFSKISLVIGMLISSVIGVVGITGKFGNVLGVLGYVLGYVIPIMYAYSFAVKFAEMTNWKLFAIITALTGAFMLIQKFGTLAMVVIGGLSLAFAILTPSIWGATLPFLKILGIVLLVVGAVDLLIQGILKLSEYMGSETASKWSKEYETFRAGVIDTINLKNEMDKNTIAPTPQAITPTTAMGQIDPISIQQTYMNTSVPNIPMPTMQSQAPITVNVTLKEAIIEPTSDVFLKRVANTLVPHIEQALNRGNVAMG